MHSSVNATKGKLLLILERFNTDNFYIQWLCTNDGSTNTNKWMKAYRNSKGIAPLILNHSTLLPPTPPPQRENPVSIE